MLVGARERRQRHDDAGARSRSGFRPARRYGCPRPRAAAATAVATRCATAFTRRHARRLTSRLARARRHVARNDQALARLDCRRIADAVDLHDRRGRHTVFAGDHLHRLAARNGDGRAAVPGPMPGRRRRRAMRGHRTGDVGSVLARTVGAETLGAVGIAAARGDGCGPARRRQRLRGDMAHRWRAPGRDRAGHDGRGGAGWTA